MIIRNSFRKVLSSFHRITASRHVLAISTILIGFTSCYNETEFLGGNLIPDGDKTTVQITDTFTVAAYTVKTDTIPTNTYSYAVLGSYNSSLFGKVKADFRTRVLLTNTSDTLNQIVTRPVPLSLELTMRFKKTYGTEKLPINVDVYELQDSLSGFNFYNGLAIPGERYYPTKISLPTVYSGDSLLTIQLTPAFASKLINLPDTALKSNPEFLKKIKGLYITCDDYVGMGGALYYLNYQVIMSLKYSIKVNGLDSIFTSTFATGTFSARYNHFDHFNHAGASILPLINDTTVQNPVFYLEGLGGVRGLIKFRGAKEWAKKMPLAIHRAELRFDREEFPVDSVPFPIKIYYKNNLFTANSSSYSDDSHPILDTQLPGASSSIRYNKAKKYYSIDVTVQLQNIIRGKFKRDYIFVESSDFKNLYKQGIFNSGSNSKPLKLIVTYTKLD